MKVILFCQNKYAFEILNPIKLILKEYNFEFVWYLASKLKESFPFKEDPFTSDMHDLYHFKSDAIFVPGNEVPYYLRGLKVQVFHGFAGEKKGHFRIRHYFDLYLTQGPYFTNKFNELKNRHKNFDVIETGWPKIDRYFTNPHEIKLKKEAILSKHKAKQILIYAPTFSPSLTSAPYLVDEIRALASHADYFVFIKFHPLMSQKWIDLYKDLSDQFEHFQFVEDSDIIPYLQLSDVLISDTSSVIYEFLILDKPVITFRNSAQNIRWKNKLEYNGLLSCVSECLTKDPYKAARSKIKNEYHPYSDGKAARRMVDVTRAYISENGVPEVRKISFLRRLKIHKIFGKPIK